jgi:hypothetical protein
MKSATVVWFGEHDPVVGSFDGQVTVGLHPVIDFTVQAEPCSIEKPSVNLCCEN